jgi:putative membrane fusion protein
MKYLLKGTGGLMEEINKRKTSNLKIGSILIIIFILIYVPSLYHWIYGINIDTDIIRNGTIEDSINTNAYLVRNEEIIISPFSGTYIPEVEEGDKIPVNFNIATVLKSSSEELLKQLKNIDLNIIKAQKSKNENVNIFTDDLVKIDSAINDKLKLVIEAGNSNTIDNGRSLHEGIDSLIQKKASIIGNTGTADVFINSLKKQKDELQKKIEMNTSEISSKASGIVSFSIDGYENQLTPAAIKDVTPQFLDSLKVGNSIYSYDEKFVDAQKPCAKIIKDFEYDILVTLDKKSIKDFEEGLEVNIRINDISKTLNGKVNFISKSYAGKYIVSINLDQYISEIAGLRRINVDLIIRKKPYEGFKIPLSCLKDINLKESKAKIIIVDANYAKIKDVKIIGTDSEFAIIDNPKSDDKRGINLYDIYVIRPGNIKEGQIINQ